MAKRGTKTGSLSTFEANIRLPDTVAEPGPVRATMLKAARLLGLTEPHSLLARADEVIE